MRRYILTLILCVFALIPAHSAIRFRAAWIATVANIDWPQPETIGQTEMQKETLLTILDSLQALGMNAVIFQVRPTADALYLSELEPTSHWLTGTQGHWGDATPYDALQFICEEAHSRHMEVHVWLNPFRLTLHTMNLDMLAEDHIYRVHPEWFWKYGKQWYFNPALPETRDWICMVVEDICCRYDIDAIHMDDYFYPYPLPKTPIPDRQQFLADPRGFTNINDWRRDNVNLTIEAIHNMIRRTRPEVRFGISPFGVWRNSDRDSVRGSQTKAGMTNYDDLYADILLWIEKGWIDYVVPQLYWEIGKKVADYETLAHWWAEAVRGTKVELYIGMAPYRLGGQNEVAAWKTGNEIVRQMHMNRTIPEITGECFYSTRPLLMNPLGVCDSIRNIYSAEP